MIQRYIDELQEYEIIGVDGAFNDSVPIQAAIDILQRFEVDMINSIDCEQLQKLQDEYIKLPQEQE
jgi:hypothetical protein